MASTTWALDPTHSEIGFKIRHLMISNVSGTFKNFKIEVKTENDDFSKASIKATIEANSINTNNEARDGHLRNSDFFESEKYPELIFNSTKIEKVEDQTFIVHGDFTMKGITKPVKLNLEFNGIVNDPWGNERAGFLLTGKINRSDWGINFNNVLDSGGLALGEEVKLNSEIELVKVAAAVAA
jgi:polyisoprenoid-binding protein YceI